MKPDWKNAPEWANWLAMDNSGEWFWYEIEPLYISNDDSWMRRNGKSKYAGRCQPDPETTLETRPQS